MEHKLESDKGIMNSKTTIALIVFLLIGAFFLITEHWAHLAGWLPYLPYLLLLACLLMHLSFLCPRNHYHHMLHEITSVSST